MESEEGRARLVKTEWDDSANEQFRSTIVINCLDRTGLLADISGKLSSMHIPIYALNTNVSSDRRTTITTTIGVSRREHLDSVVEKLRKVKSVLDIQRVN